MITIGCCKLFSQLCTVVLNFGLMIFFSYSFIILPSDLMNNSKLLGFYIILAWITTLPHLKVLFLIILNYGTTIDENIWKTLIATGKLVNLCSLIAFCIGSYYMIVIGPFFNSCGIYAGQLACTTVRTIAFLSFLGWCLFGIVIIYFIIVVLAYIFAHGTVQNRPLMPTSFNIHHEPNMESVFQRNDPVLISATQFLEYYNPIPDPEPLSKCAICQETPEESDEGWTRLACNHTGHQVCLSEWFRHKQECPYCRAPIRVSETNDFDSNPIEV